MKDGFIKVAAATPDVRVADCEYNATEIIRMIHEMEAQGAKIMVFPELCITAYTCGDLFWQRNFGRAAGISGNVVDAVGLCAVRIGQTARLYRIVLEIIEIFLQREVVLVHDRSVDFSHIPEMVRCIGSSGGICLVAGIAQHKAVLPGICHHPLVALGDIGDNFSRTGDESDVESVTGTAVGENIGIDGGTVQRAV